MRHCTSKRGHGGLVIGSEMSGSVRNVFMHDCDFTGTDRVLRIKSRPGRGGVVEKIWVRDVTARDLQREVVILNMDYSSDPNAPVDNFPPTFREIHVSRVAAVGAPVAIRITGLKDSPIRDITFEDMTISSTRGVIASDAKNLTFKNINLTITKGPRFELTEVTNASLDQAPLNN
jgi:hypothetical protein